MTLDTVSSPKPSEKELENLRKEVLHEINHGPKKRSAVSSVPKLDSRPSSQKTISVEPRQKPQKTKKVIPPKYSTPPKAQKKKASHTHKKKYKRGAWSIVVVFIVAFALMLYIFRIENTFTNFLVDHIPFPAIMVGGSIATLKEYRDGVTALETYYKTQSETAGNIPDKSTIEQQVVMRTIDVLLTERAARQMDIHVTPNDLNSAFKTLTAGLADDATTATELQTTYGWNEQEFKTYDVYPFLLQQRVEQALASDNTLTDPIRARAESAIKRFHDGEKFTDIAHEVSEEPNASSGGDLGWVEKGTLLPNFEKAVFSLESGEVSNIIRSPYGFHIFFVEEKDEAHNRVHARDIYFQGPKLGDYLTQQKQKTRIIKFVP